MKKILFLLAALLMTACLSGCAYQMYHARNFKPVSKKDYGCRTWSDNHHAKNTMKYYYKLR
jgi:uncharacterized protein YxeA